VGGLAVTGNYTQTGDGRLAVFLDGNPGSPPPLTVGGNASLAGELDVAFPDGFTPNPGDRYVVLTAAGATGRFDTAAGVPDGVALDYGPGAVSLTVPPVQRSRGGFWFGMTGGALALPDPAPVLVKDPLGEAAATGPLGSQVPANLLPAPVVVTVTAVPQQVAPLRQDSSSLSGGSTGLGHAPEHETSAALVSGESEQPPPADEDRADAGPLVAPELDPPPMEEMLSGSDIAGALLTGSRPRADVLPQKGSSVASVATLLADDGEAAGGGQARTEEGADLQPYLIDPVAPPAEDPAVPPAVRPLAVLGAGALGLRTGRRKRAG
jgi:hypothetical protein